MCIADLLGVTKLLPGRSKGVEAGNLGLRNGVGFRDLATVIASTDLLGREEGSCNLRRNGDPSGHLEPIYAFASSAGEAT